MLSRPVLGRAFWAGFAGRSWSTLVEQAAHDLAVEARGEAGTRAVASRAVGPQLQAQGLSRRGIDALAMPNARDAAEGTSWLC